MNDLLIKKSKKLDQELVLFEKYKNEYSKKEATVKMEQKAQSQFTNKKLLKFHKQYHANEICSIASNNSGQTVASAASDQCIKLYDIQQQDFKSQITSAQGSQYTFIDISQTDNLLIAATTNKSA